MCLFYRYQCWILDRNLAYLTNVIYTHPATSSNNPPIGVLRAGTVDELFLTTAPQAAFTCADVIALYLHRGAFETVLSDEDREQNTDRWCSRAACGKAVLANCESMALESSFGVRTASLAHAHA